MRQNQPLGAQRVAGRLDKCFPSPSITFLELTHEDVCLSWNGDVWQNQPLGGSTSLVSVCSISAYADQMHDFADGYIATCVSGVWGSIPSQDDPPAAVWSFRVLQQVM